MPLRIDEELDSILIPLAELESGEWGNGLTGKEAFDDAPLVTEAKEKLKQLINQARLEELQNMETSRRYSKDYQESLDELDDYKQERIKQLTENFPSR